MKIYYVKYFTYMGSAVVNTGLYSQVNPNIDTADQISTNSVHIWVVLIIVVAMGALGGYLNVLKLCIEKEVESLEKAEFIRTMIMGIVASILVPLFLSTISSNLIKDSIDDYYKLFNIAGFCILSALSSNAFINTLTKKMFVELKTSTETVNEKVDSLQEKLEYEKKKNDILFEKNKEPLNFEIESDGKDKYEIKSDDEKYVQVLKVLINGKYSFRSEKSISYLVKFEEELNEILSKMQKEGLVDKVDDLWGASHDGHKYLLEIEKKSNTMQVKKNDVTDCVSDAETAGELEELEELESGDKPHKFDKLDNNLEEDNL